MNPFELAEQLGEAILASPEYQAFTAAKNEMDNSNEALDLVELFQSKQQDLRDTQLSGKKVSQEQIDELRSHQRAMVENKEISTYLESRKKVDALLAAVNETISRITGMETGKSHGHSHGDGGGCSGGCC